MKAMRIPDDVRQKAMSFTGAELIDGTIEGAMQAGLQAYPV